MTVYDMLLARLRRQRMQLRLFTLAVIVANAAAIVHVATVSEPSPWRLVLAFATGAAISLMVRDYKRLRITEAQLRALSRAR